MKNIIILLFMITLISSCALNSKQITNKHKNRKEWLIECIENFVQKDITEDAKSAHKICVNIYKRSK